MTAIDIGGLRVTWQGYGAGETVVALHCTGGSSAQWRRLGESLPPGWRLVAPDLLGHGQTAAWHGRRPITLADDAAIAVALAEHAGGSIHLVGHSFGGAVALRAAAMLGDRVRSLTLIEPVALHLLREGDHEDTAALAEITSVARELRRALSVGDCWGGFGRFLDYWNGPGTWASVPESKRDTYASGLMAACLNFAACLTDPARPRDLAPITVPALVLAGDRSPGPTRRVAQRVTAALPNARQVTLEGAGHMAPLTHADAVYRQIRAHVERHRLQRRLAA